MTGPYVEVASGPDALTEAVASRFIALVATAQAAGRIPHIVLTGGSIADALHRRLASTPGRIDWSRVALWWGDERFVGADDGDRNAGQARRALLNHVDVDPALVHEMPPNTGQGLPAAAEAYASEIAAHGPEFYDLVMLGIGPDGHCASLFPGYPQLHVSDQRVVEVNDSPKPPPQRLTMTLPELNRGHEVWLLASGESKAAAVGRALQGDAVESTPAAGVRGSNATRWFLDADAATEVL